MRRGAVALAVVLGLALAAAPLARECPAEDATNCTWRANSHGNGAGRSFVDVAGLTIYLPR